MSVVIDQGNTEVSAQDIQAYLLATVSMFFIVLGIIIAKAYSDELPLIGLSFWRWVIAAVIMLPFVWNELKIKSNIIKSNIALLTFQGIMLVYSSSLLFYSVNHTSAINATLVNAAQPVTTAILAWVILKEVITGRQTLGIGIATVGVAFMIAQGKWQVLVSLNFNKGDLLLVIATIGYSLYSVNLRKLPAGLGSFASLCIMLFLGSFCLIPFYMAETHYVSSFPITYSSVVTLLVMAILVSILSMVMWNKANQIIGANRSAVFVCLAPFFGAFLATTYLNEQLYLYHIIGGILVCSGIFLVVKKRRR